MMLQQHSKEGQTGEATPSSGIEISRWSSQQGIWFVARALQHSTAKAVRYKDRAQHPPDGAEPVDKLSKLAEAAVLRVGHLQAMRVECNWRGLERGLRLEVLTRFAQASTNM